MGIIAFDEIPFFCDTLRQTITKENIVGNGKRSNCIHGTKFCKHTTVTPVARKVAEFLNNLPDVTKISNGIICGKGPSQFGIKFNQIHGGWMIKVFGAHAVQKLHVYSNNPEGTKQKLIEKFPNSIL